MRRFLPLLLVVALTAGPARGQATEAARTEAVRIAAANDIPVMMSLVWTDDRTGDAGGRRRPSFHIGNLTERLLTRVSLLVVGYGSGAPAVTKMLELPAGLKPGEAASLGSDAPLFGDREVQCVEVVSAEVTFDNGARQKLDHRRLTLARLPGYGFPVLGECRAAGY